MLLVGAIYRTPLLSNLFLNMKKKLLHTLLIILLVSACSKEDPEILSVSNSTLEFGWKDGNETLVLNTNRGWSISNQIPSWISISSSKTKAKNTENIHINVEINNSYEPRTANIVLKGETLSTDILVIQSARGKLQFKNNSPQTIEASGKDVIFEVDQTINYEMTILDNGEEWIQEYSSGSKIGEIWLFNAKDNITNKKNLHLKIFPNYSKKNRSARIVIYNEYNDLSDTISVRQKAGIGFHPDGETIKLLDSSLGGVNLIIMGDGFTIKDLEPNGYYDECVRTATKYFFSIEPYKTYIDYFNVYAVYAVSEERGVSRSRKKVNNKFKSTYGTGTEVTCNDDLVLEYAKKVFETDSDKPLTIMVVLNDTCYAGTTYLMKDGNSIALCPMSTDDPPNDFEGIVHHEAGGHGFGFLCDEYVYNEQQIPQSVVTEIKEWQKLGFQMNLDFTENNSKVLWKDFIGLDGYDMVGLYEGGAKYQYGVWRSEENSCMNNNIPYFNVQSRWTIVKRIMEISGYELSLEEFLNKDKPMPELAMTRSEKCNYYLGNPIRK